jgi:hypothetical protein
MHCTLLVFLGLEDSAYVLADPGVSQPRAFIIVSHMTDPYQYNENVSAEDEENESARFDYFNNAKPILKTPLLSEGWSRLARVGDVDWEWMRLKELADRLKLFLHYAHQDNVIFDKSHIMTDHAWESPFDAILDESGWKDCCYFIGSKLEGSVYEYIRGLDENRVVVAINYHAV